MSYLFLFSVKEVDNTLTVIIVSVLGGVIGLVIIVMVIKALVVHFLLKDDEKKWVDLIMVTHGIQEKKTQYTNYDTASVCYLNAIINTIIFSF